jgi:hypothetical protein
MFWLIHAAIIREFTRSSYLVKNINIVQDRVKCTLQSKLRELLMQYGIVCKMYYVKCVQRLMHKNYLRSSNFFRNKLNVWRAGVRLDNKNRKSYKLFLGGGI